jgi:hypothetical protein
MAAPGAHHPVVFPGGLLDGVAGGGGVRKWTTPKSRGEHGFTAEQGELAAAKSLCGIVGLDDVSIPAARRCLPGLLAAIKTTIEGMSAISVSWSDIMAAFWTRGIDSGSIQCWSKIYALIDLAWIRESLASEFAAHLVANGLTYEAGNWKCDHFAIECLAFCNRRNAKSNPPDGAACAFGLCNYTREADGAGHSINAFVTRENGVTVPYWWEPQNQTVITIDGFTRLEKATMKFYFP